MRERRLIAQPLFWQNKITGAPKTLARFAPSWKSPSEAVPSPKYAIEHALVASSFAPIAQPTACTIWVATGTQIGAKRFARGS